MGCFFPSLYAPIENIPLVHVSHILLLDVFLEVSTSRRDKHFKKDIKKSNSIMINSKLYVSSQIIRLILEPYFVLFLLRTKV